MSANYAKSLPRDVGGAALQEFNTQASCLGTYSIENAAVSSFITLSAHTTVLEIGANGNGAVMRWVRTAETEASVVSAAGGNFHHVIGAGTVRRFVIPKEVSAGGLGTGSTIGINLSEGLYRRVAYKSLGIASVLLTEF